MILTVESISTIVFISGFLMRLILQHVCFESPLSWLSRLGLRSLARIVVYIEGPAR
jgi:hypothetical protein